MTRNAQDIIDVIKCEKCEFSKITNCQDGFKILSCRYKEGEKYPSHKGKWIGNLTECPRKEASKE